MLIHLTFSLNNRKVYILVRIHLIIKTKLFELAKKLEGMHTIQTIQDQLDIDRARAVYIVYKLRKKGYVKTKYTSSKMRVYYIYVTNPAKGISYIDIINKYAPTAGIKLADYGNHIIYGKIPSIEETLIYAINRRDVRFLIASLALFRKITNWSYLYKLAKKDNLVREVAALYDIARLVIPKIRRMPKRFKTLATPKKSDKYKYFIEGFSSKSFTDLEKKWKVYIPLNTADLEEYEL